MKNKLFGLVVVGVVQCSAVSVADRIAQFENNASNTQTGVSDKQLTGIVGGRVQQLRRAYEPAQEVDDETSYPGYYGLNPVPFFPGAVETPEEQVAWSESMVQAPGEQVVYAQSQEAPYVAQPITKPAITSKPKLTKAQKRKYGLLPKQNVSFMEEAQEGITYPKEEGERGQSFDAQGSSQDLYREVLGFVLFKSVGGMNYDINYEGDRRLFLYQQMNVTDNRELAEAARTMESFAKYIQQRDEFYDFLMG